MCHFEPKKSAPLKCAWKGSLKFPFKLPKRGRNHLLFALAWWFAVWWRLRRTPRGRERQPRHDPMDVSPASVEFHRERIPVDYVGRYSPQGGIDERHVASGAIH